jgi:hypothetical protein
MKLKAIISLTHQGEQMTKESTYDTEIAPLMARIIATCKAHKIALIADFKLDDDLHCTTALLGEDHEPSPQQLQASRMLSPRNGRVTMITTRDKDDNVVRMDAIIG